MIDFTISVAARRAVLATTVAVCVGCAPVNRSLPAFGPEPLQQLRPQPPHKAPKEPFISRIPPGYPVAVTLPAAKAIAVQRTRMDDGDPSTQNYEVHLEVIGSDPDSPDGDELLAAWMTGTPRADGLTQTRLAVARSADGGASFAPVVLDFALEDQSLPFDPTVGVDPVTGIAYVAVLFQDAHFGRSLWAAASAGPGSAHFLPAVQVDAGTDLDKNWLAAGALPDGAAAVYLSDTRGVRQSLDGGVNWSLPARLPEQNNLLQPVVLPGGSLGVSYFGLTGQTLFARIADFAEAPQPVAVHTFVGSFQELSRDAIPGRFRAPPTAMFASDATGERLYAVLHDVSRRQNGEADLDILLKTSTDGGATWSAGLNITGDLVPYSDQFLPWLAVDAGGGLHLAYMEAQPSIAGDAAEEADVHVWYAYSTDEGASWTRHRLTPQAIPSGRTRWQPLGVTEESQFVGDYFTIDVSRHAAYVAHPVYEGEMTGMAVSRIAIDATSAPIRDPRGLAGLWYEPATSGQGFQFDWIAGNRLTAIFYGHRDDGSNLFLTGVHGGEAPAYGQPMTVELHATSGGRFNGFDSATISNQPWGTLELRFDTCDRGYARLQGNDGTKELQLERLALPVNLPCD